MHLKPRPMSEAPLKEMLLLWLNDRPMTLAMINNEAQKGDYCLGWQGFILLSDLLSAAEIVAAITPEGYEYGRGCAPVYTRDGSAEVLVIFKPIAPTVEYEYVAEANPRTAKIGDWIRWGQEWREVVIEMREMSYEPRLCFRRVEVKR